MKVEPIRPAKIVYSTLEHALDFVPAVPRRIEAGGDEIVQMKSAVALARFRASRREWRNRAIPTRDERAADHDRGLNEIGPDDGFDPAKRGVDRCQNDDHDGRADVNQRVSRLARANAANHFVGERERDGRDVKSRAGCEHAREHENRGRRVLGSRRRNARSDIRRSR